MMGTVSLILIGVGIGGAIGALLTTFVAYSKGFKQGFSDGEAEGLRGVSDGDRVHAEDLTHAAQ